jgi:cytochrome c556
VAVATGIFACFNDRMMRFHFLATCCILVVITSGCGAPPMPKKPELSPFTAAMRKIGRNADHLKRCQNADWKAPPDHADLVPLQEATTLTSGLQEAVRTMTADRNEEFQAWMRETEASAQSLEDALRANTTVELSPRFKTLEANCEKCHDKYRY